MTEGDVFLSISEPSTGIYKEKGSKFLAFAYPVSTEEEVREHIQNLKKEYYDARHVCYAFIIGKNMIYRASDGGEPAHTAGDPILNQIRSQNLTDVLVAVVRYFGGTKLGASGLINAYKTSAADALENAEIIEKVRKLRFDIHFGYERTNEVLKLVKDYDAQVIQQQYDMDCLITIEVRASLGEEVFGKFSQTGDIEIKRYDTQNQG